MALLALRRLNQLDEIRFAATRQDALAHLIPQSHKRREVRSRRPYRLPDFDAYRDAPGKPLVAAQHRSRAANDARENRQVRLRRHLERACIESGKARPAGEGAFRKENEET